MDHGAFVVDLWYLRSIVAKISEFNEDIFCRVSSYFLVSAADVVGELGF
jgi:hypothetical protein